MLDQRLLRDNPELISRQLGRRGMEVDLTKLQLIAKQERDLEEQRSNLPVSYTHLTLPTTPYV